MRTNGELSETAIVRDVADAAARKITRRVIRDLQQMPAELSGDHPGLRSVWDEVCAQVQFEQSFDWEAYDQTICGMISGHSEELPRYELEAIWLQTNPGIDWSCEESDGVVRSPVVLSDIERYVANEYVYDEAGRWSNARIREYIERSCSSD